MCSNETALFKARNIFQYDRLSDTCCVLMAVAPPLNNARQTRDFSGCSQLQFISGLFCDGKETENEVSDTLGQNSRFQERFKNSSF